jgi:lipid-binding SYLF domain-containing protein
MVVKKVYLYKKIFFTRRQKMKSITIRSMCLFIFMLMVVGCAVAPKTSEGKKVLTAESDEAIAVFKAKDTGIQRFFDSSYGYAVIPKIFKGAFIVGGAHGRGEVFEQGNKIGHCDMTQISGGISFGGEFYREIIFFKDKQDLDKFKTNEYVFSAQMTAVALSSEVAAKANYKAGMAVFIATDTGLMADASLGGQKFRYVPLVSSK